MADTQTDLVIQISTSGLVPGATSHNAANAEENRLIMEVWQCLQPGVEIALIFSGYMATTSILWLTEPQLDHSFRAGVRLLRVSALRGNDHPESTATWDEVPHKAVPVHADSPSVPHHW
jgi:hypothetical protein